MLVNRIHEINITSRNITKYKSVLNDSNIERGKIIVSSQNILSAGTAKVDLKFVCDRCGKEYSRLSCKVLRTGIDSAHYCYGCTSVRSNQKVKESGRLKEISKRRVATWKSRSDYDEIRNRITNSNKRTMVLLI